ncbi:MAG TPA: insulinase family protein [Bacteriovoracaceae bacterium]|nr:insulinase family protein [Bacteriovoracaceae bacterium]
MKIKLALALVVATSSVLAEDNFLSTVKRMKINDYEVVWLEDKKFPSFTASVYFNDGALKDSVEGLTQVTFDQLSSGTSKENEKEIAEFFDFYGASINHSVTHEYSVFTIRGLTKDIKPVVSKVCELFNDAQYPQFELSSYVARKKSNLRNLVTSHSNLADRIFRNISLEGTNFSSNVDGTLASLDKIQSTDLKSRLAQIGKAKKTIYLAGPKDVRKVAEVISKKCKWSQETELMTTQVSKPKEQTALYLVPVPGANQAQIRIGRYLNREEASGKEDQFQFLSGFLGGGFTSKLIQELRVKRGLTYSAGAYISMQRDYGRAGVVTFSKNETTAEVVGLIRNILSEMELPQRIDENEFKHQQGHQIGGHAFDFEKTNALLARIISYDHQGKALSQMLDFPEKVAKMTPQILSRSSKEVFPWEKMTIVVVGDKSLVDSLSKIRPVKIIDYKDFL